MPDARPSINKVPRAAAGPGVCSYVGNREDGGPKTCSKVTVDDSTYCHLHLCNGVNGYCFGNGHKRSVHSVCLWCKEVPKCRFWDGTPGSCERGADCWFEHVEHRRAVNGRMCDRETFVECYSGTAEWDAADPAKRSQEGTQRIANEAAGRGKITDAEVETEQVTNEAAGRGAITEAELRAERVANKAAGRGTIATVEAAAERVANEAAGRGKITDTEAGAERAANEAAGRGKITDAESAAAAQAAITRRAARAESRVKTMAAQLAAASSMVSFAFGGSRYTVDVEAMTQTNEVTGHQRRVRRTARWVWSWEDLFKGSGDWEPYGAVAAATLEQAWAARVPGADMRAHWRSAGAVAAGAASAADAGAATIKRGAVLFPVAVSSGEYTEVAQLFRKTAANTIVAIERVENLEQHKAFAVQKDTILRVLAEALGDAAPCPGKMVRRLFHGTSTHAALNSIVNGRTAGFSPLLSGSATGAIYGDGTYFARDARYSRSFSSPAASSPNIHSQMLLVDVVVGVSEAGRKGAKVCSVLPGHPYQRYTSLVNTPADPSMFVVQDRTQAYPAYVITFAD